MYPTSIGIGSDPATARVIEELALVLNDVEHRLAAVRVGVAQAFPQLAPALLARTPLAGFDPRLTPLVNPLGLVAGIPTSPTLGFGLPAGVPTLSPFGIVPRFGAVTPFATIVPNVGAFR